jgi:hypothetical protein
MNTARSPGCTMFFISSYVLFAGRDLILCRYFLTTALSSGVTTLRIDRDFF